MATSRVFLIIFSLFLCMPIFMGCEPKRNQTQEIASMLREAEATAERMRPDPDFPDDDVGFDTDEYHSKLLALLSMYREQEVRSPLVWGSFVTQNDSKSAWLLVVTWVSSSSERPELLLYDFAGNMVGKGDVDEEFDTGQSLIRSQYFVLSTPSSQQQLTANSHPIINLSCEPKDLFGLFSSSESGVQFVRVREMAKQ